VFESCGRLKMRMTFSRRRGCVRITRTWNPLSDEQIGQLSAAHHALGSTVSARSF
jgi:hypothetical protein